jgi:hypothetical protein
MYNSGITRNIELQNYVLNRYALIDNEIYDTILKKFLKFIWKSNYLSHCFNYLGKKKWLTKHQLVWFLTYKTLPKHPYSLDHIDIDTSNNKVSNLRVATPRLQNLNRKNEGLMGKKISKFYGVTYASRKKKYRARIVWNKKSYSLGYYDSEMIAHMRIMSFVINHPMDDVERDVLLSRCDQSLQLVNI